MDIIIGEESGTTLREYDANVEVTRDGTVVAKVPLPMGEGLPVQAGERVEGYKPIAEDYSTTLVYRGTDGKLRQGCAPESVRVTPAPFEGSGPAGGVPVRSPE